MAELHTQFGTRGDFYDEAGSQIGGYSQLSYGFNYYGPVGSDHRHILLQSYSITLIP